MWKVFLGGNVLDDFQIWTGTSGWIKLSRDKMGKSEEKRQGVVILIQNLFCICEVWNYLLISNKFDISF